MSSLVEELFAGQLLVLEELACEAAAAALLSIWRSAPGGADADIAMKQQVYADIATRCARFGEQ